MGGRGQGQGQLHNLAGAGAATFHEVYGEAVRLRLQVHAQRGGGGLRLVLRRAKQHGPAVAVLGGELQAAQLLKGGCRAGPAQHRAASAGAERLLDRPEVVVRLLCAHPQYTGYIETAALPGGCVRNIGRIDQREPAFFFLQLRERGQQQAQLAETGVGQHDLGEGAARPAAARQCRIERGVAARDTTLVDPARALAAPELRVLQQGVEGVVHKGLPFRNTPTPRPSMTSGWRRRSTTMGSKASFSGKSRTMLP